MEPISTTTPQAPIFDLTTRCTGCGYKIAPAEIRAGRALTWCAGPKFGATFTPEVRRTNRYEYRYESS